MSYVPAGTISVLNAEDDNDNAPVPSWKTFIYYLKITSSSFLRREARRCLTNYTARHQLQNFPSSSPFWTLKIVYSSVFEETGC